MSARFASALLPRRGYWLVLSCLSAILVVPSCTQSEDTEPFVPATEGAVQPPGGGAKLTEEEACSRLLRAAGNARKRLDCSGPALAECPGFLRPGGGSGCYEYSADSVEACEDAYDAAVGCSVWPPCIASAERNDTLSTCELPDSGDGAGGAMGAAGAGAAAGAGGAGGSAGTPDAGAPSQGGAAAGTPGGAPSGGAEG